MLRTRKGKRHAEQCTKFTVPILLVGDGSISVPGSSVLNNLSLDSLAVPAEQSFIIRIDSFIQQIKSKPFVSEVLRLRFKKRKEKNQTFIV